MVIPELVESSSSSGVLDGDADGVDSSLGLSLGDRRTAVVHVVLESMTTIAVTEATTVVISGVAMGVGLGVSV